MWKDVKRWTRECKRRSESSKTPSNRREEKRNDRRVMQTQAVLPGHLFMFSQQVRGLHIHTSTHPPSSTHLSLLFSHLSSFFLQSRVISLFNSEPWCWIQPLIENEPLKLTLVHEAVSVDGCCKSDAVTREREEKRGEGDTEGGGHRPRDERRRTRRRIKRRICSAGASGETVEREEEAAVHQSVLQALLWMMWREIWCVNGFKLNAQDVFIRCRNDAMNGNLSRPNKAHVCLLNVSWCTDEHQAVFHSSYIISKPVCDVLPLIVLQVRSSQGLDRPSCKKINVGILHFCKPETRFVEFVCVESCQHLCTCHSRLILHVYTPTFMLEEPNQARDRCSRLCFSVSECEQDVGTFSGCVCGDRIRDFKIQNMLSS